MSKQVIHAHDKLVGDMVDRKKHFKLYKSGKQWLIAGAVVASLTGLGLTIDKGNVVKADTIDNTGTVTQTSDDTTTATSLQKKKVALSQSSNAPVD